jgi:Lipase (class 3)
MTKVVEQMAQYPDYRLLITGHSLGGAIGTLLVISMGVSSGSLTLGDLLSSVGERSDGGYVWTTTSWKQGIRGVRQFSK